MQTNIDKIRLYRDTDKETRVDKKRDKYNPKELIRKARRNKLSSREID